MTWKRHFQQLNKNEKLNAVIVKQMAQASPSQPSNNSFASYLPEVYAGHPRRIDRYTQYDVMDQDSEVNAALDTICDFSTRTSEDGIGSLFNITYNKTPQDTEVEILKSQLMKWCNINSMKTRLWRIFRNTLKYGDQFFIRDPETNILYHVDHTKVEKIIVDEANGKKPQAYVINDLDLNLSTKVMTPPKEYGSNIMGDGTPSLNNHNHPLTHARVKSTSMNGNTTGVEVDANHVVHFSLSEGLDANWPFGTSILEPVFKVFKQKELLEDSIVIYRVQRAPERRVFYIDVGGIPPNKTQAYLDRVKMDVHQRRIPTRNGGGNNIADAAYNPLSIMEDYFFAQTPEGRGSRVDTLPGGDNLGQIDDLRFFNNKLIRGLRVPSSYLPTGPEDGTSSFSDGRVGTAYIQEYRFANYCQRLQMLLASVIEDEFKLFVKRNGYNIDASTYNIEFNPPQNFRAFEQIERDAAQMANFTQLSDISWLSKRFIAQRFLGLTEDEIVENERMWKQENMDLTSAVTSSDSGEGGMVPGLDSVGFRESPESSMGDDGGDDDVDDDDDGDAIDLGDEE